MPLPEPMLMAHFPIGAVLLLQAHFPIGGVLPLQVLGGDPCFFWVSWICGVYEEFGYFPRSVPIGVKVVLVVPPAMGR